MSPSSLPPPPPTTLTTDDPHAADPARRRLASKSSLARIFPFSTKSPKRATKALVIPQSPDSYPTLSFENVDIEQFIHLDASNLDLTGETIDKYEWAIVYENQRGLTAFSIPYYSSLSLLPTDPAPFTIPSTSSNMSKQMPVTLEQYPLPDGAWRWVSKAWMIDMRSDSGEVQYDGFEYNWRFRSHNWRAEVGPFSVGGWVRRRRWVRLMMRPAETQYQPNRHAPNSERTALNGPLRSKDKRTSDGSSSVQESLALDPSLAVGDLWFSDDVEINWSKCRSVMRKLGRDGPKVEQWQIWLSACDQHRDDESGKGKGKGRQIEEKHKLVVSNVPRKDQLLHILQSHGKELLELFVYPDSRAKMVKMLGSAGLLDELETEPSWLGFWSYLVECGLRAEKLST